ncbi:hypothetical protein [Mucilaginibacter sp. KACC 22063]|uniref:hypothetical protein n=1 Tax=Mucilaginibacter sp. KACC 22063 TaxID=3025666 RepID=UPI0023665242|nr:hypothetical protein [Mucilaginibacter sp. KACC 22063]WDF53463.1 hypothetical protein PQ461_10950 [Mucilaginibacter sp. KACC 22063]
MEQAQADNNINRFYGLDENGPYSEFLSRGLRSLRMGFYKICSQPYYNKSINPPTFAATVLYFHPSNSKLIKYNCNIGPIINLHKIYNPVIGTIDQISKIAVLNNFEKDISTDRANFGYTPKLTFFNSIYSSNKLFLVKESIFDPNYPNSNPKPKRVTWSFLDF